MKWGFGQAKNNPYVLCFYGMKSMYLASDHRGLALKSALIPFLEARGYRVADLTPPPAEDGMIDFPLAAQAVAKEVAKGGGEGIVLCGSGVGVTIAANRFKGVRAGALHSGEEAATAKAHNHLNVACLGADELNSEKAKEILSAWIDAEPDPAPRRTRRMQQVDQYGS